MTAKTKKLLTILLTTLAIAAFVITPLAWFASYWNSDGSPFQPGKNADLPGIEMWMYNSVEDKAVNNRPIGWEKIDKNTTHSYNTNTNPTLPKVDVSDTGEELGYEVPAPAIPTNTTNVTFALEQMHFGVVDNLVSLKNDNIIYIRLTVDAKKTGSRKLKVNFDFLQESPTVAELYDAITLYGTDPGDSEVYLIDDADLESIITFPSIEKKDANGNVIKDENDVPVKFADVSDPHCQFVQVACAVTKDSTIVPGAVDEDGELLVGANGKPLIETLDFTEFAVIGEYAEINLIDALGGTTENPYQGEYYIYLKIAPRLEFFVSQENLLDHFVPSYIFFDTKLKIELY